MQKTLTGKKIMSCCHCSWRGVTEEKSCPKCDWAIWEEEEAKRMTGLYSAFKKKYGKSK